MNIELQIFERLRDKLIEHSDPQLHIGPGPGGFISLKDLINVVDSIISDVKLEG